jgi:hypothetical protein
MKSNYYLIVVIACMINISPIFGQSRAKKKEIIADSKIAKRIYKTDPLWKYFWKRTATLSSNVGKVGLS